MHPRNLAPAETLPQRSWYSLQSWRRRSAHQKRIEPLCRMCLAEGRVTSAQIADHIVDHAGSWNAFVLGQLQSLCAPCHERKHGRLKGPPRCDVDANGYPVDPNHPFNAKR
jgi:5-methylcytosine-specific restriction endonuclease McrA